MHCKLGREYKRSYFCESGWLVTQDAATISVRRRRFGDVIKHEVVFDWELFTSKKKSNIKAAFARLATHLGKLFKRKSIWLISDKVGRGDDNGEALFLYLQETLDSSVKPYFIIEKGCQDYHRLRKMGRVIPYLSYKHKLLFLKADNIIMAYPQRGIINPFQSMFAPFCDLMNQNRKIFLQHGITQNDVTKGLNRFNKNFSLVIAAADREREAFIKLPYFYTEQQIKLTGFARYDRLYNEPRQIITIAPTWRKTLFGGLDILDVWSLRAGFEKSAFYQYYMGLVNSSRLLETAEKYGYTIQFIPHTTFLPYIDRFVVDPRVVLLGQDVVYRQMFAESSLVVTDYSSIAFDFAYLRKPVIYTQFDKDEFFSGSHGYSEGYFDYEENGFGEVEYDLDSTIDRIVEYIEGGCQLKDFYRNRIDSFFAYADKNNCQRIYEVIKQLDCEGQHAEKMEEIPVSL